MPINTDLNTSENVEYMPLLYLYISPWILSCSRSLKKSVTSNFLQFLYSTICVEFVQNAIKKNKLLIYDYHLYQFLWKLLVLLASNTSMEVPDMCYYYLNLLRKKYHIDQIGTDWYQFRSFGCRYLGLPLLWCCHIYLLLDLMKWLIQRRKLFCCLNVEVYIQKLYTTFSYKSSLQRKLFQKYFPLN